MKGRKQRTTAVFVLVLIAALAVSEDSAVTAQAKKVRLNKKNVTIEVGGSIKLRLKNNHKKVKWSTANKKIATVSKKGLVRAKKAGTTKIKAKAGGKRYVCRVRVVKVTAEKSAGTTTTGNTAEAASTQAVSTPVPSTASQSAAVTEPDYPSQVLALVNEERAKTGAVALVLDESLCQAATTRANELVTLFSHTRPDGTTCFSILTQLGISYTAVAENIAEGYSTPETVMTGWMASSGHKSNILNTSYGKLGVGYVEANSSHGSYWVQLFTN